MPLTTPGGAKRIIHDADEGVGIVVSSHILRELDRFGYTVALIQKGRLEVHRPVEEVIDDDVGRRRHHVEVTRGLEAALEVLRKHEGPIEGVEPLQKDEEAVDPETSERGRIKVCIHGEETRAATTLEAMVLADVEVIAISRVRSDLEDVFQSIGRDEVS